MTASIALFPKERPILFSGSMVMAILGGRKTQTRRVMKRPPELTEEGGGWNWRPGGAWCWTTLDLRSEEELRTEIDLQTDFVARWCPYGRPGDRLWVRESLYETSGEWWYSADSLPVVVSDENYAAALSWAHHKETSRCPSIHMPRFASRLTLEVVGVRVERIQDISAEDCFKEGVTFGDLGPTECAIDVFHSLWDEINGDRAPWKSNPWVWAVEFRRVADKGGGEKP